MDVQSSSRLLLLCQLLQLVERIEQRVVVLELEQLVVVQFVLVFQWIVERILQWFVQRPLEFGTFFFASIIERGGAEQQCRRAK